MKNTLEFNLEIVIDEYAGYVFKIVDNIIGTTLSYQDKEEIVSDTFYLLWKNQNKINTNLKAYLSVIARNTSYDRLRKNKFTTPIDENMGYENDFDTILEVKEKLNKLTHEELMIFELFYLKGLKIKEICIFLHSCLHLVLKIFLRFLILYFRCMCVGRG